MNTAVNLLGEYRSFVWDLFKPEIKNGDRDQALCYLAGKLANESTEFLEVLFFKPEDNLKEDMIDEMGDVAWYIFNLFNLFEIDEIPFDINTASIYKDTSPLYLCATTGRLLGETLKRTYHGKDISDETLIALLKACLEAFICCLYNLKIEFEPVLQTNMDKLKDRHGKQYDAKFYTERG